MKKPASIKGILDTASQSKEHLAELNNDFRSRMGNFRKERGPEEQKPLEQDFEQVLRAWGIEDAAHIPAVLRELRLRILVFALPVIVCLCAALLTQRSAVWLAVALVTPPCLLGMLTTTWRLSVLGQGRFQSFMRWLWSLVSFAKKGS